MSRWGKEWMSGWVDEKMRRRGEEKMG